MIGRLKYSLVMLAVIAGYTWVLVRVTPRWFANVVTAAVVALSVWRALRTGEWGLRGSALLPSLREYSRTWGLTPERVARMRPGAPVMHPGPMNEGIEIDPAVAHGTQSLIETQVTNGVAVRMALLYLLAGTPSLEDRG